jgi:hypothetical protein
MPPRTLYILDQLLRQILVMKSGQHCDEIARKEKVSGLRWGEQGCWTIFHVSLSRLCVTMPTVTRANTGKHMQLLPELRQQGPSWSTGCLPIGKVSEVSDRSQGSCDVEYL